MNEEHRGIFAQIDVSRHVPAHMEAAPGDLIKFVTSEHGQWGMPVPLDAHVLNGRGIVETLGPFTEGVPVPRGELTNDDDERLQPMIPGASSVCIVARSAGTATIEVTTGNRDVRINIDVRPSR